MSHPLDFIPERSQKRIFFPLLTLTFILFAVFRLLDAPLQNPVSPQGIVSFELAATPEKANAIIQAWDAPARLFAAFGLGLDYLFMPAYSLTLSLGVLMVMRKQRGRFLVVGAYLGWGVLLAVLFDAVENIALWRLLSATATPYYPSVAAFSAIVKFTLLLLGIAFALLGWLLPKKTT